MSKLPKEHSSIRVVAPPGGRSANIFAAPEPEPPMPMKKNHMESDIFGCKKNNTDSAPAKPTRTITNNIFGIEPEQSLPKLSVYSDKNKSTIFDEAPPLQPSNKPDRQRSTIFAIDEPIQSAPTRPISEKYKSNIFGFGDDDTQNRRQQGTRQGLRGRLQQTTNQDTYRPSIAISLYSPLRLKVGYNPINGQPYSTYDGLDSKVEQARTTDQEKQTGDTSKTSEEENEQHNQNNNDDKLDEHTTENGNTQKSMNIAENGNDQVSMDKPSNGTNGHSKNPHTSVRVAHPPGGRSNGPFW